LEGVLAILGCIPRERDKRTGPPSSAGFCRARGESLFLAVRHTIGGFYGRIFLSRKVHKLRQCAAARPHAVHKHIEQFSAQFSARNTLTQLEGVLAILANLNRGELGEFKANKLLCDRRSRNVVISALLRVLGGASTAKEVFHRLIKDDLAVRKLHVVSALKPNESLLLSFAYRCLTLQRALVP
jgi:hypothetical protein